MSVTCPDCGEGAGYGREIGHKSDCPSLRNPNLSLRMESIQLSGDFQRMSPTARLPWKFGRRPFEIVDADGGLVAVVHGKTFADSIRTAGMIITAANTCGGIKMTEAGLS